MSSDSSAGPRPTLTVLDGVAVVVGVVVGSGIFGLPPLVAGSVDSSAAYMVLWLAGGVIMLAGALCYAELGSAYPGTGGEYQYLSRAYGPSVGILFAWARGTVIQTGSIAAVAFIYGDYANQLVPLGANGASVHAVIAVVGLTGLNILGTRESKRTQVAFTFMAILAVVIVIAAGWIGSGSATVAVLVDSSAASRATWGALGMGMVFVLLTYGGWNEAAYLSAELQDPHRNLSRVLLLGTVVVVALYVFANLGFLAIFGLEGLRNVDAVGAELMLIVAGPSSAVLLSLLVGCTALSTMNGTILTGARVYYALGRDVPRLRGLGTWSDHGGTPGNALLLQGAITLVLVLAGALSEGRGISTMVAYISPVFWLFMLLTGLTLFIFRHRDPGRELPFRVPLYPLTPALFCLSCAGLLYSSTRYAGTGALVGLAVLAAGVPLVRAARRGR